MVLCHGLRIYIVNYMYVILYATLWRSNAHEVAFDLHDLWVGGVLVKICIIVLCQSTFLKEKQIHYVIKFSFVFGLTDL